MKKGTLILNIKDLALLKSNPEEYYKKEYHKNHDIIKNHDYHGMIGSLNNHVKGTLYKFNKKHRNDRYRYSAIIDDAGNILSEKEGDKDKIIVDWTDEAKERQKEGEMFHLAMTRTYANRYQRDEDIRHLTKWEEGYGTLDYPDVDNRFNHEEWRQPSWKSISSEGADGTRMTLAITDMDKFNKTVETGADWNDSSPYYNQVVKDYGANLNRFRTKAKNSTETHMKEYINNAEKEGVDINSDSFKKQAQQERRDFQKEFFINNAEKEFNSTIKNAKKFGMELTIGWMK